jgi:hypothetical protein
MPLAGAITIPRLRRYLKEIPSFIADIFEIDMGEILNKIADDNQIVTDIIKMDAAPIAA